MNIGEQQAAEIREPVEDPFRREREVQPEREPVKEREPEKVPA